jgi:cell division protein FtsW
MIGSISGKIKEKAALMDPGHYGRSDTSPIGRWFWEIDKVLLLLVSVLIGIGLIAVAAASPAAAHRYSGGDVRFSELYYFWRQLGWIAVGVPVMIAISMMPRERARRLSLFGAVFFFVLLVFVPIIGPEHNGARRWIEFGVGQVQPSEFLKPFFVVAMAWLLSLREADKSLPVYSISAVVVGGVAGSRCSRSPASTCGSSSASLSPGSSESCSLISSTTLRPHGSTNSCSAPATISRPKMRCGR